MMNDDMMTSFSMQIANSKKTTTLSSPSTQHPTYKLFNKTNPDRTDPLNGQISSTSNYPAHTMIVTGSVGESSYDLEDSKVFALPSMSQLILGDQESAGVYGTDNNASLNFEDLMSMKAPAGVDFHASYDQVPKAKVKIPKKLKLKAKKKNLNDFNKSCPSFRHDEKPDNANKKNKGPKVRRRKSKRPQSAMERPALVRSLSFTSSPPQHFDIEIPKPKPIPPRRTKSLHSSFPVGGSFDQSFDETSQVRFSSGGAFKPLHSSASSFPAGRTEAAETDFTPIEMTRRMHQSFTVMPSESGEFLATSLSQKEKIEQFQRARDQSKKTVSANESLRSPRAPPRRRSEVGIVPVVNPLRVTASERLNLRSVEGDSGVGDDILASPRKRPSLPARSKSLNGLGLRIESRRKPLRRKLSQRVVATPESPRRQRAVLQQNVSSPGRPIRQHSPRRGKRPSLLTRSKSEMTTRSSDSTSTLESEPHTSSALPNPPRRVKSLYVGQKKRKSNLRVNSTDPDHNSISAMHDSFSVSASESVPIATFAYSKNNPQSKSQIKKSNEKILSLLAKWKRKAKKEDGNTLRPLRSLDLEWNDAKDCVPMTPETSICKRLQRKLSRRQSKTKMKFESARTSNVNAIQLPDNQRESARSHSHSEVQRREEEHAEKVSLADVLETKEARLEGYMTRTPQNERKKVDRYWVEAFKRNYSRRSDSALPETKLK